MKKNAILLNLFLFTMCTAMYSQDIFSYIEKTDRVSLEKDVIKKTRKRLKIDDQTKLSTITAFSIDLKKDFSGSTLSDQMFIDNIEPQHYKNVVLFVYDDSLNVVTCTTNNDERIAPINNPEISKQYLFVQYFLEKSPDYIFEMLAHQLETSMPIYISYKEGKVEIVYLEIGADKLTITPLSEFKNIEMLNPLKL